MAGPSVAIVGNSPRLLGRGLGASIDGCDAVVRFNLVKTQGFEVDTGRRTTHWMVGINARLVDDLHQLGRPAFLPQLQGIWLTSGMEPRTEQRDAFMRLLGDATVPVTSCPLMLEQILWDAVGKHPTTGAIGIALAAHLFPGAELRVCGMGRSAAQVGAGHYHHLGQQMWAGHDFDREEVLLEAWAAKGLLRRLD